MLINTCQDLIARAKGEVPVPERRQQGTRRTLTLPITILDRDGRPLYAGRLLNLSAYGARVELPGPLSPGQRVAMEYAPPSGVGLAVEGCVQWWQHLDASSSTTSHGIGFTGISEAQRRAIQEIAALE